MWKVNHDVDIRFSTEVKRSDRVLDVSQAFGLELSDKQFVIYDHLKFDTAAGERLYITGQSGSGKSLILRKLEEDYRTAGLKVVNINDVELTDEPIIEQIGTTTDEATKLLQFAGIGDAYLLIRTPNELSDGQKYRLRIAKLLDQKDSDVWLCDEFGAVLDRKTAKFLAYSVSKLAEKRGITVAIATTHKDLITDYRPHLVIDKQYAHEIQLRRIPNEWYEEY